MPSPPRILLAALIPTLLASCRGQDQGIDTASECGLPVAQAGADLSRALGATVTLDASSSQICDIYVDAGSASYSWDFERVPVDSRIGNDDFSIRTGVDAVTTSFTPDVPGDYIVGLTITDPSGTSNTDLVVIAVQSGDAAPRAICGGDHAARVDQRTNFDGSDSYDPEGAELTWSWSLSTTPDCSALTSEDVYNADQAQAAVVPDCEGLYLLSLVVSDGVQWSEPDYCTLDVADGNRLPEADAGDSTELPFCTDNPLRLNAWGSYDLDGDDLTYMWSVVSVPSSSLVSDDSISDPELPDPTVEWDVPGAYTFELQVHDGQVWSSPDIVTYTISSEDSNTTPVSNAGSDVSVSAVGACVSSSYIWTCSDCPPTTALLDGSSSYDPDGDPVTYQWTESTGVATFSNDRSAVTDIEFSAMPAEYSVDNRIVLEADLELRDCAESDTDTVLVTYTCTGEYLGE